MAKDLLLFLLGAIIIARGAMLLLWAQVTIEFARERGRPRFWRDRRLMIAAGLAGEALFVMAAAGGRALGAPLWLTEAIMAGLLASSALMLFAGAMPVEPGRRPRTWIASATLALTALWAWFVIARAL